MTERNEYRFTANEVEMAAAIFVQRHAIDRELENRLHPTLVGIVCELKGWIVTPENQSSIGMAATKVRNYVRQVYCPEHEEVCDGDGRTINPYRMMKYEMYEHGQSRGLAIKAVEHRMPAWHRHYPQYGERVSRVLSIKTNMWAEDKDRINDFMEKIRQKAA